MFTHILLLQFLSIKAHPQPPPCWGGVLLCAWPLCMTLSTMVQFFITAWRVDHKRPRRRRPGAVAGNRTRANSRPRETREEARQKKYRYLYQVRTAHGDIISQVFLLTNHRYWAGINEWLFRIMFLHYKNESSPALAHHRNRPPKQILMNATQ